MDLNGILLVAVTFLTILILILVSLTLYEFIKLDKEQFKFYIIGLILYCGAVISFFLRYIVFPPLTDLENVILGMCTTISPLVGMFYFIKGTEYLAQREQVDLVKNEKLYSLVFYFLVITIIYQSFLNIVWSIFSKNVLLFISISSAIFYFIVVFLALKYLFGYKNAFSGLISDIIYQYIVAVIFLIAGGVIVVEALEPISFGKIIFTDLSYLRTCISFIGLIIVFIPFLICYRSVSKFRKLLTG